MADWLSSMQQTFEYYIVDPVSWKDTRRLDSIISSTIERAADAETLGSATIDTSETLGECYVRIYLITIQNGIREKHPLGTFLVQTPAWSFNGKIKSMSVDAYTPLLELKEKAVPLGYSLSKGMNIMDMAYQITRNYARAPVVKTTHSKTLFDDFVANTSDTWITYLRDLVANAKYTYSLDEMGRILFAPDQELDSLQPVWTYDDGNSSILYPEISMDRDLYGIPNVVEVTYSNGRGCYTVRVVNDDSNSPTSTINRGREIPYYDTSPALAGDPTEAMIKEYAERLLRELSTIKCTITYSHGYCPVRLGDCVRLNCSRADLSDIKAKVISQTIYCRPGCQVTEKAVFTNKLWR